MGTTTKMQAWEKRFVNGQRHSSRVASQADRRLRPVHPRPGQRLLDVGCGSGAAAIHLAQAYERRCLRAVMLADALR
jgi:cyclopropane fatty-acyl-phospholipid synthase-like methyltransferase